MHLTSKVSIVLLQSHGISACLPQPGQFRLKRAFIFNVVLLQKFKSIQLSSDEVQLNLPLTSAAL